MIYEDYNDVQSQFNNNIIIIVDDVALTSVTVVV